MLGISCLLGFLILTNTQASTSLPVSLPLSHQGRYNRRRCSLRKSQGLASLGSAVYTPGFLPSFSVEDCEEEEEMLAEVSYLQGLMSADLLW